MKTIAKKSDWKTRPMPKATHNISVKIEFSDSEYESLKKGLIPKQMEDKWFLYFHDNNLFCHRSWTGHCIYLGRFKRINGKNYLYEININDNKKEYKPESDYFELSCLLRLIKSMENCNHESKIEYKRFDNALEAFEDGYCKYYHGLFPELGNLYSKLLSNHKLKLNSSSITKAIILRLKTYYETQDKIVKFLNKKSVSPASDFFVETVVFYLKLLFEQRKKNVSVKSEFRFYLKTGYIKPDISIWKDGEVVAIIECKTNLGFARKKWELDFLKRERQLKSTFSNAKAFLLVLSSKNWNGFDADDKRVNSQFFALSNTSLRKIKSLPLDQVIENRIENLFSEILKLCK